MKLQRIKQTRGLCRPLAYVLVRLVQVCPGWLSDYRMTDAHVGECIGCSVRARPAQCTQNTREQVSVASTDLHTPLSRHRFALRSTLMKHTERPAMYAPTYLCRTLFPSVLGLKASRILPSKVKRSKFRVFWQIISIGRVLIMQGWLYGLSLSSSTCYSTMVPRLRECSIQIRGELVHLVIPGSHRGLASHQVALACRYTTRLSKNRGDGFRLARILCRNTQCFDLAMINTPTIYPDDYYCL